MLYFIIALPFFVYVEYCEVSHLKVMGRDSLSFLYLFHLVSLFFFLLYVAVLFLFPMLKSRYPMLNSWYPNGKGSGKSSGKLLYVCNVYSTVKTIKIQAGSNKVPVFLLCLISVQSLVQ